MGKASRAGIGCRQWRNFCCPRLRPPYTALMSTDGAGLVLVVDDNAENRALAQATLEDEGYEVRLAPDGEEALAALARQAVDCVVMDVRMPRLDGIATCQRLRSLPGNETVAVVFVTAQRDVEVFDRAVSAGGDDFLTKPYRPDELVLRVQTAVRLRRLAAERTELVSELRKQRDRLQRLELQREQLIGFLVHDLKNPVNVIGLQAELLHRWADRPDKVHMGASRIAAEKESLLRMITNILDIGRADEDRLSVDLADVDVRDLCQGVAAEFRDRASMGGVRLTTPESPLVVRADPDLIKRILANLIDNALRHAPEDSTVAISAAVEGPEIELAVRDEGPGIPGEMGEAIFDRFVRGGARSDRANRGLGLAFCKVAVAAQGGRIWVENAHPGARFRMRIPRGAVHDRQDAPCP